MQEQEHKILTQAEALFMRVGIKSVTMQDLSRELGISKKTLYQYVENKADLVLKIMFNHAQTEMEAITKITTESKDAIDEMLEIARYSLEQLREISPTLIYDLKKYYRKSWDVMEKLHQEHSSGVIVENFKRGIEEGLYRNDFDIDIVSKLYVSKTFLLVEDSLFPLRKYDRRHLMNEFIKYHLYGIVSPKGKALLEENFRA